MTPDHSPQLYARRLQPDDHIPPELMEAGYVIDPQWAWGVFHAGKMKAILLCGPVHGILFMYRLRTADLPKSGLVPLLRAVLRDARAAGFKGYMSMLALGRDEEYRIARIATKAGATLIPWHGVFAAGTTEVDY